MNSEIPEVVCYLCGIVDDNVKIERGIKFNNSAAENKVLGICNALKPRVKHIIALSEGRGGERSNRRFPAVARRVSNITVLYAAFWHTPLLSHFITAFSLVLLLLRLRKLSRGKQLCLIAYNRKWIYLPVLCVAQVLNVRCYLDLEDAAMVRNAGLLQRFLSCFEAKVMDGLCSKGALCASSLLMDKVNQRRKLVCHGVAYKREGVLSRKVEDMTPVRILFGGYLSKETGAQLLIDAVNLLEHNHQDICGRIQVVVTGQGPLLVTLKEFSLKGGAKWIEFHGDVNFSTYQSLLTEVDVGLCLKLPSSEMCNTTFPSKVIEYASFGKAVLSTGIADVVSLFGEDGAYLLRGESVEDLALMLRKIALEAELISGVAKRGQQRLIEKSGKNAVAKIIMHLLTDEKA